MRDLILALLLLTSGSLSAQTAVVTVSPQQCVWRSGDDMSWANPAVDDSGWRHLPAVNLGPGDVHLWVRCNADLSPLRGLSHPAIQVGFDDAYQLFIDGQTVGAAGNLRTGNFSVNSLRSFPLPSSLYNSSPRSAVVALRVTYRNTVLANVAALPNFDLKAGDEEALRNRRASIVLTGTSRQLATTIYDGVIGVFGFVLLGLYFNDRNRTELLLLSLNCLGLATIFLNIAAAVALVDFPAVAFAVIYAFGTVLTGIAQPWFSFRLAGRRVPLAFWVLIGFGCLDHALWILQALLPLAQSLQINDFYGHWAAPIGFMARIAVASAPFVAFWPYSRVPKRVLPLAILCMVWGANQILYFSVRVTIFNYFGVPNLAPRWGRLMNDTEPIATFFVIAALMWLLFREQRQVVEERAEMAGEMQAARHVQEYLIPAQLPATPGLDIESEYRPAREVGGDFFQMLPQPADGSVLIVVGDVAGKGMEAGMLAALIVGAVRTAAEFTTEPDRILSLLNKRLQGRGLVTCLALRIERDGAATLANAGHLPPYLNGDEMAIDGALPLGAVAGIDFPVSHFNFSDGDSLILMTDGVAEAQDAQGRLFGFERIGELLHKGISGAELAASAQNFGQQDDITVITLRFAPVAALAT